MRRPKKTSNLAIQRRLDLHTESASSAKLRDAYADVDVIQIALTFSGQVPLPSPQQHSYFQAARAFFRFSCPCTDCDGEFDLTDAIAALAKRGDKKKPAVRSDEGTLQCSGVHWRVSSPGAACRIELAYRIEVTFVR